MIYLVIEKGGDSESGFTDIIYATENKEKAEAVKIESENRNRAEIEKSYKILDKYANKYFEDFSIEEKKEQKFAYGVQYRGWFSTDIKKVELNEEINIYI